MKNLLSKKHNIAFKINNETEYIYLKKEILSSGKILYKNHYYRLPKNFEVYESSEEVNWVYYKPDRPIL